MDIIPNIMPYIRARIVADLHDLRNMQYLARILIACRQVRCIDHDLFASIIATICHAARRYHKRDWRDIPVFSAPRFPCELAIKSISKHGAATMRACTVYAVGYHNINVLARPDATRTPIDDDGDYYVCEYHDEYLCGMINAGRNDSLRYYLDKFETAGDAHLNDDDIFGTYSLIIQRTAKRCILHDQSSADPFHEFVLSLVVAPEDAYAYYSACVLGLIAKNRATLLRELLQVIPNDIYALMRDNTRYFIVRNGSAIILRTVLISDGAPVSRGFTDEEIARAYESLFHTSSRTHTIAYVCARWSATYPWLLVSARMYCRRMILKQGILRAELIEFCLADSEFMTEIRALPKIDVCAAENTVRLDYARVTNPRIIKMINGFWSTLFPDREPVLRAMK